MQPRNLYSEDTANLYEQYIQDGLRYRKVAEALLASAGSLNGLTVVDLGCGTGILTRMLPNHVGPNGHVIGIDASADMLAAAKRTSPASNITFIQSLAETVDKEIHQQVDAVFSSAAFWQFQREPTLTALAKVMTVGGMLHFNLSAGFFDFQASGLANATDAEQLFKQHEILAKWVWMARKRYPEKEFPPRSGQKAAPQSLKELTQQLERFGFKLESVTPLRFEIPRNDEYRWLKIPQWTDHMLPALSYAERVAILDEIFMEIPQDATFLARWVTVSARLKVSVPAVSRDIE